MGNKGSVTTAPDISDSKPTDQTPKPVSATTNLTSPPPAATTPQPKEPVPTPTPYPKETSITPALYPKEPSSITTVSTNVDSSKAANPPLERNKTVTSSSVHRWYRWPQYETIPTTGETTVTTTKSMWYRKPIETSNHPISLATVVPSQTPPPPPPPSLATNPVTAPVSSPPPTDTSSKSSEIHVAPSFQLRTTSVMSASQKRTTATESMVLKDEPGSDPNAPSAIEILTQKRGTPLDVADVPTYISRGVQADLHTASAEKSNGIAIRYYEKQPVKVVPLSTLTNLKSNNEGFYHLTPPPPPAEPVLPPVEKTPAWSEDARQNVDLPIKPSTTVSVPPEPTTTTVLPPPPPPPPKENSLPVPAHDKVVEEIRKQNGGAKDGTYRVKKIHFFEKLPWIKSGASKNRPKSSKASQSISRSEQLFFSQSSPRKK